MEEKPAAVDGSWGDWKKWSKCTRECGGGITMQSRHCDNPTPANGGAFCVGMRHRYQVCNEDIVCPDDDPGFREQQCSAFDNKPFKDEYHTWLPFTLPEGMPYKLKLFD